MNLEAVKELNDTDYLCFQLLSAITGKLEVKDGPMEQDLAEGVDSDEWVSLSTMTHEFKKKIFLILLINGS